MQQQIRKNFFSSQKSLLAVIGCYWFDATYNPADGLNSRNLSILNLLNCRFFTWKNSLNPYSLLKICLKKRPRVRTALKQQRAAILSRLSEFLLLLTARFKARRKLLLFRQR